MSKILIIENEQNAYNAIVTSVPLHTFLPLKADFEATKQKLQTNLTTAYECISDFIQNNYSDLRCIICDLKLGSTSGKDIVKHIRNDISIKDYPKFNKYIPIIAYTQYADPELLGEALRNGADVVLRKSAREFLPYIVERQVKQFSSLCNELILKKPYKVGITFCGKDSRDYVREMANSLALEFSKHQVFFDEFHQEKITNLGADEVLQKVYTQSCDYVVLVMSKNYEKNHWTGKVEWKAIKDSLIPNHKDTIIAVLYGKNANVSKINLHKDIVIKADGKSAQEVAEQIRKIIVR